MPPKPFEREGRDLLGGEGDGHLLDGALVLVELELRGGRGRSVHDILPDGRWRISAVDRAASLFHRSGRATRLPAQALCVISILEVRFIEVGDGAKRNGPARGVARRPEDLWR